MWILEGLDEAASVALKEGSNLQEAEAIAAGLAKILSAVPTTGAAKAIDIAQLQRVLANKKLFRHPVSKMSSTYAQIDLLKDLAQVAKHTDADGAGRLIKALKSDSARVSGNRYALSFTADRIKNGGATEVKFIGKFVGKWGTKGAAELDLVCKEAGQWVIYEIKSTYKAIGSRKRFLGWVDKVERGWPTLGLGPLPKIKITSPLENSQNITKIPDWLKQLHEASGSIIKYAQGISFK